ncbi:hypothetical protein MMC29_003498, partial [Sticta canariensis]|nr:hypothetical protein [Sticta canariensis]
MLSSTDVIKGPGSNHQSSTIRARKSSLGNPSKKAVLHHPLTSPPLEDWVLFPDQVIHTKHSTVRDSRMRQAKERLHPAELSRLPLVSTTETSRATSTSSRITSVSSFKEEQQHQSNSSSTLDRPSNIGKSTSNVAEESRRNPPRVKIPQRLPTPDLSDVDEDGFWSCCGSSEGGL